MSGLRFLETPIWELLRDRSVFRQHKHKVTWQVVDKVWHGWDILLLAWALRLQAKKTAWFYSARSSLLLFWIIVINNIYQVSNVQAGWSVLYRHFFVRCFVRRVSSLLFSIEDQGSYTVAQSWRVGHLNVLHLVILHSCTWGTVFCLQEPEEGNKVDVAGDAERAGNSPREDSGLRGHLPGLPSRPQPGGWLWDAPSRLWKVSSLRWK